MIQINIVRPGWWCVHEYRSMNRIDIHKWLDKNIGPNHETWYKSVAGWCFKNEDDAMLFQLTWSDDNVAI